MRHSARTGLLAFTAIGITVGVIVLRNPEPVYEGKRLTTWLKPQPYRANYEPESWRMQERKLDEVLRQIGTNAFPALLRMLEASDSPVKVKLMELAQRQRLLRIEWVPADAWNHRAARGFRGLGPEAREAVPAVIRIADRDVSRTSQSVAFEILGSIGPAAKAAVPSLLRWSTNANWSVRKEGYCDSRQNPCGT